MHKLALAGLAALSLLGGCYARVEPYGYGYRPAYVRTYGPSVYVAPRRAYVAPRPVYVAPRPVVITPPRVYW